MFLFNDALNTFCLRLSDVGHMEKDHSDSQTGNPLPPHGQGFFYMHHPTDRIAHSLYYTSRGALAGTRCCTVRLSGVVRCPLTREGLSGEPTTF